MLKAANLPFTEAEVELRQPDTKAKILEWSPSGKVPLLIHGSLRIWDSLAIGEYLAEQFPNAGLWPSDLGARALARSISAEMHSGFQTLRSTCPMDLGLDSPLKDISDDLLTDIKRIEAIWTECRTKYGPHGPYLFGSFTIADAMFAPVATRFKTYHLPCNKTSLDYVDTLISLPWMQDWTKAALF
jgi:glutathione S-transferase